MSDHGAGTTSDINRQNATESQDPIQPLQQGLCIVWQLIHCRHKQDEV
jgi:hypothetical protein